MKPFTDVRLGPFPYNVLVAIGPKGRKCLEKMGIKIADSALEGAGGLTHCLEDYTTVVIYLKTRDYGALAHEAVHAANMVFEEIGHKGALDDDEVMAYVVGHIVAETVRKENEEEKLLRLLKEQLAKEDGEADASSEG